ncbi:MAG: hypothetical protein ACI92S_000894 [Planctomycetaceae bacterium]|jgi:hypothetical protein
MRRIQSLFKTLLMLIPMTAVPVMAVFGIPQFFPVSASPSARTHESTDYGRMFERRVGQSDALLVRSVSTSHPSSVDLFEPYDNVRSQRSSSGGVVANASSSKLARRRLSWRDPLAGSANTRTEVSLRTTSTGMSPSTGTSPGGGARSARPSATISRSRRGEETASGNAPSVTGQAAVPPRAAPPSRTTNSPASAEATGDASPAAGLSNRPTEAAASLKDARPDVGNAGRYSRLASDGRATASATRSGQVETLTWQQAVDRLNQLGIRTFRLTPNTDQNGYRFVCLVTSVDDPRISRRFEAESIDPLVAVGDVLAQVENWNLHR